MNKMMSMLAVCGLLCLTPTVYADPGTLSLTGTGSVSAEPDEGYITVGVQTKRATSAMAVRDNSKLMSGLFKTLNSKTLGVQKKDFKTIDFRVQQNYKTIVKMGHNVSVPDGFIVINRIRITVCDLEKMGTILDIVVQSGANRVNSISFGSSEAQKHLDAARKKAIADVRRRAEILTGGLGVKLGRIMRIAESSYQPRREVYSRSMDRVGAAQAVPISGGSLTFTMSVSVSWELMQHGR